MKDVELETVKLGPEFEATEPDTVSGKQHLAKRNSVADVLKRKKNIFDHLTTVEIQ